MGFKPEELAIMMEEAKQYTDSQISKNSGGNLKFVNSINECTDTSKLYVLPDGYIYAYTYTEKPAYTNVIPTAVDLDGTLYNGGIGYKKGWRYSTASGEIEAPGLCVTGYIPIRAREDGTIPTVRIKNITLNTAGPGTVVPFEEYDGTDKHLGVGTLYTNGSEYGNSRFDENGVYTLTDDDVTWKPDMLRYIRITANSIDSSSIITIDEEITDETVKTYAWTNTGYAFMTEANRGEFTADGEIPEIVIPNKLYGVVGHEFVLYYDNILRCMIPDSFIVTTVFADVSDDILSLAPQFDRMLKFTPTANHVGVHDITIKVISRRTWETVATKQSSIVIVADTARTDKKVLFIGDSLTEASIYAAEVERMSDNGIVSIGTISKTISFNGGTATVQSEGRSGWGSYDYMNNYNGNGFTNPFYNPNASYSLALDKKYYDLYRLTYDNSGDNTVITHNFDFAYYVENAGVGVPDAVFINLGTNGGNLYAIESVYVAFDAMIERIRAYSQTIPIFLYLFPPTSRRGDSSRTANGVRNVNLIADARIGYYDCIKKLIDRYENDARVIIVPTYTMLDTLYDYKTETTAVSARCDEKVTIGNTDNTHPAISGYLHMADSFYNVLQYLWSL